MEVDNIHDLFQLKPGNPRRPVFPEPFYMFDYYMIVNRYARWHPDFLKPPPVPTEEQMQANEERRKASFAAFMKNKIGHKRIVKEKNLDSMFPAQMHALNEARFTGEDPYDDHKLFFPHTQYTTTFDEPMVKRSISVTALDVVEAVDKVDTMIREVAFLRQRLDRLTRGVPETPETEEEATVRRIRTHVVITDVNRDKKLKVKLSPDEIDAIQQQVEAKIQSDRNSSDNGVYQRNHAMLQHLMRRRRYSKSDYKTLKQYWRLLSVSGDLLTFTGKLFDRDYLNPKSDKYYKYVSMLAFMLKYQRLSKVHTKLWFKDAKDRDTDGYFFGLWQQEMNREGGGADWSVLSDTYAMENSRYLWSQTMDSVQDTTIQIV